MDEVKTPNLGPTVEQATEARIKAIKFHIEELEAELSMLKKRLNRYRGSKMLEAERVASMAEAFMTKPITGT